MARIPPQDVATKIIGATPGQEKVLREILGGIGPTPLRTIEVRPASKDVGGPPDSVELNMPIPEEEIMRMADGVAAWHALLIANAFQERSRELGLPPVAFYTAGNGGEAPYNLPEARDPGLTDEQAREIAKRVARAAILGGAKVLRLELIRPRRVAFMVVLQADHPASFMRHGFDDAMKPLDDLRTRKNDGRYVKVVDGKGERVLESGAWFWIRDDVARCPRILLDGPRNYNPPPCPVD